MSDTATDSSDLIESGLFIYIAALTAWSWHYFSPDQDTQWGWAIGGAITVGVLTYLTFDTAYKNAGGWRFTAPICVLVLALHGGLAAVSYAGLRHDATVAGFHWPPAAAVIAGSTTAAALVLTLIGAAAGVENRLQKCTHAVNTARAMVVDAPPAEQE